VQQREFATFSLGTAVALRAGKIIKNLGVLKEGRICIKWYTTLYN